ncbi:MULTISPECIES: hypothetical protein [Streptomyces]|uniref:hypothetical protein n=1 Tax=Streptomyces TaxID=1883 RepID=UPI00114D238A|nr:MULTISPECIES: hypothetical protein [Streptomyces]
MISAAAADSEFARDTLSPQWVSRILNGKNFPTWHKMEALVASMLSFGDFEEPKKEISRFRQLWVPAHYGEWVTEPPLVEIRDTQAGHSQGDHLDSSVQSTHAATATSEYELDADNAPSDTQATNSEILQGGDEFTDQSQYVRFVTSRWSGPEMFSIDFLAGMLQVSLNSQHPMGAVMLNVLSQGDAKAANMIKLLLFSWARMEDETLSARARERVVEIRQDWSRYAADFMEWTESEGGDF